MKAFKEAKRRGSLLGWSKLEIFLWIIQELIRKYSLSILRSRELKKKYLKKDKENRYTYFDFNGAKLPDISKDKNLMTNLVCIFDDTFLISCLHNDNYDKNFVETIDTIVVEGPYGYQEREFTVKVSKDDIVIDAGAWIGDFSAYAASKGATVYAFEPTPRMQEYLKETSKLNNNLIIPVQLGLGEKKEMLKFRMGGIGGADNTVLKQGDNSTEDAIDIQITSIDDFVRENNIERIDFIKSDIEGAERDMLRGARETLKNFAPKLAICTYHFPDDPYVLHNIIMEANPNYRIVHTRHKLFATVIKE